MWIEQAKRFARSSSAIALEHASRFQMRDGRPVSAVYGFAVVAAFGCDQRLARPFAGITCAWRDFIGLLPLPRLASEILNEPVTQSEESDRDDRPGHRVAGFCPEMQSHQELEDLTGNPISDSRLPPLDFAGAMVTGKFAALQNLFEMFARIDGGGQV